MNANDEVNIHSYVVGVCSEEEIGDFLFLSISSVCAEMNCWTETEAQKIAMHSFR